LWDEMLKDHSRLIHRLAPSADFGISEIRFIGLLSFSRLRRKIGLARPEERRISTTGLVATLRWWAVLGQSSETRPAREPVAADHRVWQLGTAGQ
jgi:hypothetical protein